MTNKSRRNFSRKIVDASITGSLMRLWSAPVITAVSLPAHAQTSNEGQCQNLDVQQVNEPISISITDTEVLGPIIATRNGNTFSGELTTQGASCVDENGAASLQTTVVTFSGEIFPNENRVAGNFVSIQRCGNKLICEQDTTFDADQTPVDATSELGTYQGTVVGTLSCCDD